MNNLDRLKHEQKVTRLEIKLSQERLSQQTNSMFSLKNIIGEIITSTSSKSSSNSEEGAGKSFFKGILSFIFKKFVDRF